MCVPPSTYRRPLPMPVAAGGAVAPRGSVVPVSTWDFPLRHAPRRVAGAVGRLAIRRAVCPLEFHDLRTLAVDAHAASVALRSGDRECFGEAPVLDRIAPVRRRAFGSREPRWARCARIENAQVEHCAFGFQVARCAWLKAPECSTACLKAENFRGVSCARGTEFLSNFLFLNPGAPAERLAPGRQSPGGSRTRVDREGRDGASCTCMSCTCMRKGLMGLIGRRLRSVCAGPEGPRPWSSTQEAPRLRAMKQPSSLDAWAMRSSPFEQCVRSAQVEAVE
jgi:hypothetical protein